MKTLKQSHTELSSRLWSMAQALRAKLGNNPTAEQMEAVHDLENRSNEHARQARLFGTSFLMVI